MSLTDEHIAILEKHNQHFETLKLGYIRNLDKPEFDELQKVYNEAIGSYLFDAHCGSCVQDLVAVLYKQYQKHLASLATPISENVEKPLTRKQKRDAAKQISEQ